jgi:hypothetical protein
MVENLELSPLDQLQQGGLRLAHRERGRAEERARDWHVIPPLVAILATGPSVSARSPALKTLSISK